MLCLSCVALILRVNSALIINDNYYQVQGSTVINNDVE